MKEGRGYFVLARNTPETDYVRLAYGLALSIKASQSEYKNLSIGVDSIDDVSEEYKWAFDQIIEIPWDKTDVQLAFKDFGDGIKSKAEFDDFVAENFIVDKTTNSVKFHIPNSQRFRYESKAYEMSPYRETIKLEADMLLLSDISHWWDDFAKHDLLIANSVLDYKNDIANTDYYRQCFIANNLYSAHSCMTYFKESDEAENFFNTVKIIFDDWDEISWHMIRKVYQEEPSTDVVFGMAVTLLQKQYEYQITQKDRTFVHMKSRCMPWERKQFNSENWTECTSYYFTPELELFVSNYKQTKPFHYHVKEFLTDEIISYYEEALNG